MRKLIPFFFIFLVLIVSVVGSSGKAAAISDDFEYYGTASISDDWVVTQNVGGGELILAPTLYAQYPTTQLRMYAYVGNENIIMKNTTYPGYFSFIVRQTNIVGGLYSRVHVLNAAGTEIVYFDIATSGNDISNAKIEVILNGGYFDYYRNGVLIESKSAGGVTYSTPIKYQISSSGRWGYQTSSDLVIDDLTTGSIVGTSPLYVESTATIPFTWSAQLMRSYPDSTYNVTLYSITNSTNAGELYSWNLNSQYTTTGKEYGNFTFNRSSMLGLNYGLYLLELTKDGGALYDCYFYYDNLADPVGYPDALLMGTSTVSMDIRDSANNGGTISPDGSVYLYANNGTAGYYPVTFALKNTPYSFTASLEAVYGADKINSTPITFTSLTNSYSVALDGQSLTGGQATGNFTIAGSISDGETVTIGSDVYEYDNNGAVTEGHIPVIFKNSVDTDTANLSYAINHNGTEQVQASYTYVKTSNGTYSSMPVSIADNPGISGYQTHVTVTKQGGMNSDFSNIRVYDGENEISYFIKSKVNDSTADVWFKINTSSSIQIRWGIPGETASESDGTKVFEFYDNFSVDRVGSAYSEDYADASAFPTTHLVTGGQYYCQVPSAADRAAALHLITPPTTTPYMCSVDMNYTNRGGRSPPYTTFRLYLGNDYQIGSWGGTTGCIDPNSPADNLTITWTNGSTSNNIRVYRAGSLVATGSKSFSGSVSPGFGFRTGGSEYITISFDNFYMRKYTATEPTLTAGEAQYNVGNVAVTAKNEGVLYNSIATTTTCSNAQWDSSTLTGGLDGGQVTGSTWSYTITDWTNYTAHIFTFTPDLTKAGIYGYVKDLSTSQGIHGAIVTISNDTFSTTIQTDEQGYYYLTQGMKAGETYSIKAQKSGYTESATYSVTTKESASSRKDLYLESTTDGSGIYYQSHDVTFTVLEYWYSSAGLPGVSYEVYNGNTSVKNGTTGSKGSFTVTKMDAGTNYTFILTYNGTTYTEYLEPGLTEYNLVLNKEGIVHTYYNSWLNLSYAETSDNVTILYASNKTVSAASLTVTASNGTVVYSEVYNTSSGSFLFPSTEGDYNLQFNIEASDGSTASQAWSISSPPEISLFPDSYPTWLKNTLFVAIIIIFLLAFGKSKNDIACGAVAVLTSFGYYFKWLTCSFNFVVLIWIIALGAIYLHYKRTGAVG